jgi:hypothetical protein
MIILQGIRFEEEVSSLDFTLELRTSGIECEHDQAVRLKEDTHTSLQLQVYLGVWQRLECSRYACIATLEARDFLYINDRKVPLPLGDFIRCS